MDAFCILCHRQEFSIRPNGNFVKHNTTRVESVLCSKCSQFCMAKGLGEVAWEGEEQLRQMIDKRETRKLKRR